MSSCQPTKKRVLKIAVPDSSSAKKEEIEELYRSHSFYHPGDSGLDLFCAHNQVILPGLSHTIKLGIAVSMGTSLPLIVRSIKANPNHEGYRIEAEERSTFTPNSCLLMPRSSIIKTPLRLSNSIGLIDAGYRGELMAVVDNRSSEPFSIKKGDRLFQLVRGDLKPFSFEVVEELEESSRGKGGFGSTD